MTGSEKDDLREVYAVAHQCYSEAVAEATRVWRDLEEIGFPPRGEFSFLRARALEFVKLARYPLENTAVEVVECYGGLLLYAEVGVLSDPTSEAAKESRQSALDSFRRFMEAEPRWRRRKWDRTISRVHEDVKKDAPKVLRILEGAP